MANAMVKTRKRKSAEKCIPCPFCGEVKLGTVSYERDVGSPKPVKYIAIACGCGAHGPEAESYEKAVVKWNRRGVTD